MERGSEGGASAWGLKLRLACDCGAELLMRMICKVCVEIRATPWSRRALARRCSGVRCVWRSGRAVRSTENKKEERVRGMAAVKVALRVANPVLMD